MLARRGVALALVATLLSTAVMAAFAGPGYAADPVAWPVSTGLVLAEVVTGGASASDEYVEIYNAGAVAADLGGNELVYVTATGATVTRKASFASPLPLAPGAHCLVANAAGTYAAQADATYSGGLAADGGALALRTAGGSVIDSVAWGTAANAYVEHATAAAPPARSSIERRPGGTQGNWLDTNDNSADWLVQPNPVAQSVSSAAVPPTTPAPTTGPSDTATQQPSASASLEATLEPTLESSAGASDTPTLEPSPEPTPGATGSPSADPSPSMSSSPSADPTATPTATVAPTATPTPTLDPTPPAIDFMPIASARLLPAGTRVHVAGVITAPAGVLGSDGLIAMGDSSGGIFVRLAAALDGAATGRSIDVIGTLAAPYGQLEIRDLDWIELGETGEAPAPMSATPGDVGEQVEGSLVSVAGTIDSVTVDGGRLTVVVSDGQASVRALADPPAGLTKSDAIRGRQAVVTGIVGQHATATGREDGYRIWLRVPSDLLLVPLATPSSSAAPSASGDAAGTPGSGGAPTATPHPSATPRPTATPTPVYTDLARGLVKGRLVDVEAVVTAAAGVIDWGGTTIVIDDGTAAVAVVVPAGAASARIGARVHVAGKVGSLHNGLRVVATLLEVSGDGPAPQPRLIARALGPDLEWQLVAACGHITRVARAGQRWRVDIDVAGHSVGVLGEPGAGIPSSGLVVGRLAAVTGIVRRSTSDSDVFDLLPRSGSDLGLGPAPATPAPAAQTGYDPDPASSAGQSPAADSPLTAVSDLPSHAGQSVTVAGVVTETDGASALLDDGSGTVRLGGEAASDEISLLEVGDAIEASGKVTQDQDGWAIEVDPERVVAFAGAGLAPVALTTQPADAPAAQAAGSPQGQAGQTPSGRPQGLARSSATASADDLAGIVGPIAGLLAFVCGLGLLLLTVAWRSSRRRRSRKLGPIAGR